MARWRPRLSGPEASRPSVRAKRRKSGRFSANWHPAAVGGRREAEWYIRLNALYGGIRLMLSDHCISLAAERSPATMCRPCQIGQCSVRLPHRVLRPRRRARCLRRRIRRAHQGQRSHDIVQQALRVLVNLEHRGACGCEEIPRRRRHPDPDAGRLPADLCAANSPKLVSMARLVFLPRSLLTATAR